MEQKPTHKEDPLTTLKETLVNAISTIDRLQCDGNVVLERSVHNYEKELCDKFFKEYENVRQKEESILQKGKDVLQSESLEDMASSIAKKANDMWEKISKKTNLIKDILFIT